MHKRTITAVLAALLTTQLAVSAAASAPPPKDVFSANKTATPEGQRPGLLAFSRTEEREPCADYDPLRRPHFGDLHVHTAWSFDASTQDTRNRPIDAYRFAMGKPMGIQPYDENDQPMRTIRIDRPLDFTAVTDHAAFMGEVRICTSPDEDGYWHPVCLVHRYLPQWSFLTFGAAGLSYKERLGPCGENNETCLGKAADTWRDIRADTEQAYDRSSDCAFTTFHGYEWTAGTADRPKPSSQCDFSKQHGAGPCQELDRNAVTS